jgi:hypothetical protein
MSEVAASHYDFNGLRSRTRFIFAVRADIADTARGHCPKINP